MTKKHFQRMAWVVINLCDDHTNTDSLTIHNMVDDMIEAFYEFNPNFNHEKFIDYINKHSTGHKISL